MVFGKMTPCKCILAMSLILSAGFFLASCSDEGTQQFTLVKTGSPTTYTQVGDIITYTYLLKIKGFENLEGIKIRDPLVELDCTTPYRCTGTYEITELDIRAGFVANTAVAQAKPIGLWRLGSSITIYSHAPFAVYLVAEPDLTLTKTANRSDFIEEGQLIRYTFEIENTGNVPVSPPFVVDDPQLEQWNCPNVVLDLGEKMTCTGIYSTTRHGDVGYSLNNCATAYGIYQMERITTNSACDYQFIQYQPPMELDLTLTKTAYPIGFIEEGQLINYTFEIENTGNVPVSPPFTVNDPKLESWVCLPGVLDPGRKLACIGYYIIRHGDVGDTLRNCATVSGIYQGEQVTTNSACVEVQFIQYRRPMEPDLTLTKTANRSEFIDEGQLISYTFEIENTGSAPVSPPFTIDDPQLEQWDCPNAVLYPGAKMTCTGIYYTRHGDVGNTLKNCATASGIYQGEQVTTNSACVEIQFIQYRRPMDTTACELDPDSIECFCENNPDHQDCN